MDDKPQNVASSGPVGVPRRFSLGALMVVVAVYSGLFGLMTSLDASPTIFGAVAILFTGVAVAQMLLFGGRRPRDASYLAGAVICPLLLLAAFLVDQWLGSRNPWENGPAELTVLQLLSAMVYLAMVGVPLGYMAGCTAGGIFLVMEIVNKARGIPSSELSFGPLTDTNLAVGDRGLSAHERAWNRIRRTIAWLSPLQRGRPFRQAVGGFILLAVLVGLTAPFAEWPWWFHLLLTLAVALMSPLLIGAWLARWMAPLLFILLGGLCAVGPAVLSESIFVWSDQMLCDVLPIPTTITLGCAIGWLAAVVFGWVRRWRDHVGAKRQIIRSNRRLIIATTLSLFVLFGILTFVLHRVSRQPIQQAMVRLSGLGASFLNNRWTECSLEEIAVIDLSDTEATDADLECLAAFDNLAHLWLYGTRVTDAGLEHLRDNDQLLDLSLIDCSVNGSGLAHLKGLNIKAVDLSGSKVSDAELAHLAAFPELQWLRLHSTRVTGTGFQDLAPFPSLVELDLSDSSISEEGLRHLQGFTGLQIVRLWKTRITGTGLKHLKGLPKLRKIVLDESLVSDVGLRDFPGLSSLEELSLRETQIGDAGLERLGKCRKLFSLGLAGTNVTDAGLRHLKGLVNLEYLALQDAEITDAGLAHLKALPKLTNLGLENTEISDSGLQQLSGLSTLKEVYVEGTQVTRDGAEKLRAALPNCWVMGARDPSDVPRGELVP